MLEAVGKEYEEVSGGIDGAKRRGPHEDVQPVSRSGGFLAEIARLRKLHGAMDRAVLDAYGWRDVLPECGFALDWLDLDDELADTLASAADDIRERIELADYFFPDAAAACRFQSHIKQSGKGTLP